MTGPLSKRFASAVSLGQPIGLAPSKFCINHPSSSKKIVAKNRITILCHTYFETLHSRKKSSPHLRLIHHKYRHAAVAVDCRSASLSGPTVRRNAVWRSHGPALRSRSRLRPTRRRALAVCSAAYSTLAAAEKAPRGGAGAGRRRIDPCPVMNVHSGRQGPAGDGSASRGGLGESAQPLRPLAAAETARGDRDRGLAGARRGARLARAVDVVRHQRSAGREVRW